MIEYKDLDTLGRAELLKEQREAKMHWRALYAYQGLIIAWGAQTSEIIQQVTRGGLPSEVLDDWKLLSLKGKNTVRKTQNALNRLDDYMREIEARLSDGSRWYTAVEIARMRGLEDATKPDDRHDETPGL